jgi:hypothetical protein
MSSAGLSASARAASMALLLDACAAEVVVAFQRAGIDSILLRGPALASWLYGQDEPRCYTDVDLLVSPERVSDAELALEEMGFRLLPLPPHDRHARTWLRDSGASVDLHRSLSGVGADPGLVWSAFRRHSQNLSVHGRDVAVPGREASALMVALHVTQHGRQLEQPLEDLRRALERTEVAVWSAAAELARELGAQPAFAAGLRRLPSGSELADRLGLPVGDSVATLLRAGNPPSMALGMDWLARRKGPRAKLRFAGSKLFPSPAFMRAWSGLAKRGRLGLAASYVQRLAWVAWHAGPAVRTWLGARRDVRRRHKS